MIANLLLRIQGTIFTTLVVLTLTLSGSGSLLQADTRPLQQNHLATHPAAQLSVSAAATGANPNLVLPDFKLPYSSTETVYWTGGPHGYNEGGQVTGTYTAGQGSGLDFSNGSNFEVLAMASGKVMDASCNDARPFGCQVAIKHDQGGTYLIYAHLLKDSIVVTTTQSVKQGDIIAKAGATGTGARGVTHLHIELRDGSSNCYFECLPGKLGGNPVGWDDGLPLVDGYVIWGYPRDLDDPFQNFNYDGSAVNLNHESLQIINNFPFLDCADATCPPSTRKLAALARVGSSFVCDTTATTCEDNSKETWTQFAGHGIFNVSQTNTQQITIPNAGVSAGFLFSTNTAHWPEQTPSITTDSAAFISDVNYPDGASASPGQSFSKTWRLQNVGSTSWGTGYQLAFVGGDRIGGPDSVNLPSAVGPGQQVDVSVNLIAPNAGGDYRGNWKLRNAQGAYFGPPIWVSINVPGGGAPTPPPPGSPWDVQILNVAYPSVVTPGQSFQPQVTVQVNQGQLLQTRGDLLRNTDGNLYGAWPHVAVVGTVNAGQTYTFQFYAANPITAPSTEGHYSSNWRVWRDGNWAGPEFAIAFDVKNGGGTRPNPPTLSSPDDWSVTQGTTPSLCVNSLSGVQYYFEIYQSAATPNSSLINSNCWTPPGLGANGYQWHAKVHDNATGLESDWSVTRHFNIESATPSISDIRFNPSSPSAADTVQVYACAVDQYEMYVNTATDGSASGDWRMVTNALPRACDPSNSANWINWGTLPWNDGNHLVKFQVFKNGVNGGMVVTGWNYTLNRRRPDGVHPVNPSDGAWLNNRTITFRWDPSPRAQTYNLIVATDGNHQNQILNQTINASTTSYTFTLDQDYSSLYWFIGAGNEIGFNGYSRYQFGIDRNAPTSAVAPLPATTTQTAFQVNWGGNDAVSGVRWYDVQVLDATHPGGQWNDWVAATTATTKLYSGQAGHTYCFQSRAMDNAGNWESYPASPQGDTCTQVNPAAAPPTPWWNSSYAHKVNVVILNNDGGTLPNYYPLHIHLDNSTTPTAADVYNASVAANKGDDVQVTVYDLAATDRYLQTFTPSAIDIWFRAPFSIPPLGSDGTHVQLYYGNPAATPPANDPNSIFLPQLDDLTNSLGIWHFLEGAGSSLADSIGGHTGSASNMGWTTGKFGPAGDFNGTSSYVNLGTDNAFNVSQLTAEAWVYPRGNGETSIFRKAASDNSLIYDFIVDTHDVFLRLNGSEGWAQAHNVLTYNQWYHIAGTYDGSTIRIYINGQTQAAWSSSYNKPLRTGNSTLYLGGDAQNNNKYFNGLIQHARISNVARTSFSYGQFGNILNEPAVQTTAPIAPPQPGNPDLAVQSFSIFPYPSGGNIVQAVVQNVGSKSTGNGFLTDLYLNHVPNGASDFTGSVQFWVDDPIAAGATVTLSTVITNMVQLAGPSNRPLSPASEVSGTLYAQVDSAGVVSDTNRSNNVYAAGAQLCMASVDAYESDDTPATASPIGVGLTQLHNFTSQGDEDWVKFSTQQGITYTLTTSNLGLSADTYLYLYGTDGITLLASNDDYGGSLASQIVWSAPASGIYFALVKQWNPSASGCGTSYELSLNNQKLFLPIVVR